jgi:hypothetical protein
MTATILQFRSKSTKQKDDPSPSKHSVVLIHFPVERRRDVADCRILDDGDFSPAA